MSIYTYFFDWRHQNSKPNIWKHPHINSRNDGNNFSFGEKMSVCKYNHGNIAISWMRNFIYWNTGKRLSDNHRQKYWGKSTFYSTFHVYHYFTPLSPRINVEMVLYWRVYPVDHLPANETHIGCSMYFRNIDFGGKGDFFLKIKFSQYILTMIVWMCTVNDWTMFTWNLVRVLKCLFPNLSNYLKRVTDALQTRYTLNNGK